MIGISIYLSDIDYNYLDKVTQIGIRFMFTSLQIPEENIPNIYETISQILSYSRKHNISLIPDVSPDTFTKLGLKENDFLGLKKLGMDTIRLDYGFESLDLGMLSDMFTLVINASVIDEEFILKMQKQGVDTSKILAMHNYYPKTETGLDADYFLHLNKIYEKYDIHTLAFVEGDVKKRFPLFEGLPTLEIHRGVNPYVAGLDLMNKYKITDVVIGDNQASVESLRLLKEYEVKNIITIPVIWDKEYRELLNTELKVRKDISTPIIRLNTPRIPNVRPTHTGIRSRGSITIENDLAGRYGGEVHILKKDMPVSKQSNVIGYIHPAYLGVIDILQSQDTILFSEEVNFK